MGYLRDKKSTEYTGNESFIDEQLRRNEVAWFPFNKGLGITTNDETEEKEEMKILRFLEKELSSADSYLARIKEIFSKLSQNSSKANSPP